MFESLSSPLKRLEQKIARAQLPAASASEPAPRTTEDPLAQIQRWVRASAIEHVLRAQKLEPLPEDLKAWLRPALNAPDAQQWSPDAMDPLERLLGWIARQREQLGVEDEPPVAAPEAAPSVGPEPNQDLPSGADTPMGVLLRAVAQRPLSGQARGLAIQELSDVLARQQMSSTVQQALERVLEVLVHGG